MFAGAALHNPDNKNADFTKNPISGALISLTLTIINIVCIYFSAYLTFEIKEVRGANSFWTEDVANVRKYNKAKRKHSGIASIYEKAYATAIRRRSNSSSRHTSGSLFLTPLEKFVRKDAKDS